MRLSVENTIIASSDLSNDGSLLKSEDLLIRGGGGGKPLIFSDLRRPIGSSPLKINFLFHSIFAAVLLQDGLSRFKFHTNSHNKKNVRNGLKQKHMKKSAGIFLALLPLFAWGQTAPPWTQDAYRAQNYPSSEWYTGFVRNRLKANANVGVALQVLERDAQNQLAEGIIVNIEGVTQLETTSARTQSGNRTAEQVTTDYRQAVRTATSATTVKSEVKSWHDPSNGTLYAFAAVRRADLAAYYKKQINNDLNKVDVALGTAEQLVAAGKKMSAFRQCSMAKTTMAGVTYFQDLLTAVDATVDETDLQSDRSADLQRTLNQQLIVLEQSTFVYVDCKFERKGHKDDAFTDDPGILCDLITQSLSENNCSIVDDPAEADYELTLTTSTAQRSDGSGPYGIISYYANAKGSLYNRLTKKKIVDFAILNDPDAYAAGRSAQDAATKAFKLPALREKVLGKILPKIKN
jgi:hypothetical protein